MRKASQIAGLEAEKKPARFQFFLSLLGITLLLSSCQIYNSHFDCLPGNGVPCTPVTEIEKMIVETPEGADIFLGYVPSENNTCIGCPSCDNTCDESLSTWRVWIEGNWLPCGTYVEGHYIYLPKRKMQ